MGGSHSEPRPERVSSTGLWPCQAWRQDHIRANGRVGFEVVVGRARWVGFIGGSFVFFRGFLFSSASSSLILVSLPRLVNRFASLLHAISFCWSVFCLECCLFPAIGLGSVFLCSIAVISCAFRSTSCCLLNGFDLLSTSHIPYSQFFLQRTSCSVSTISSASTPRSASKIPEEGSSAVEFPHHNRTPSLFLFLFLDLDLDLDLILPSTHLPTQQTKP